MVHVAPWYRNLLYRALRTLTERIVDDFRRGVMVMNERLGSSTPRLLEHRNESERHMALP
jgi:hypothetical protein